MPQARAKEPPLVDREPIRRLPRLRPVSPYPSVDYAGLVAQNRAHTPQCPSIRTPRRVFG